MAELHFLRPEWFVALPVGAWLLWQLLRGRGESGGWRNVVEAKLRRYVLLEPEVLRDNRLALVVALLAWLVAVVAMAGPGVGTAAGAGIPLRRSARRRARSVALDGRRRRRAVAPRAREAEAARPARAARGRADGAARVHDARVHGDAADDGHAHHLIVGRRPFRPTSCRRVAARSPPGLDKARALLRQTGVRNGDVLLITDSEVADADVSRGA